MPARTRAGHENAEPAGVSPVPGKPLSQVEAEAPMDEEAAAAWEAEYESRVPAAMYDTAPGGETEESGEEPAGSRRDREPRGDG
jgi:hypothetical protein